jgi:ribosome maturation factor RimP
MAHPLIAPILDLATPLAATLGLEVVQAVFQTNQSPPVLRLDVRRSDRDVTLEDCEAMSRSLEEALDASEVIPGSYVLEVSSPGIPENLTDDREFISFKGFPVIVRLQPTESGSGSTERQGQLIGRDQTHVHINQKGRLIKIARSQILSVQLVDSPEF